MTHKLRVLCSQGDLETAWETGDKVSLEKARQEFDRLKKAGHAAFLKKNGVTEQIREFDPTAEEVVIVGPLVGG